MRERIAWWLWVCLRLERWLLLALAAEVPLALAFRWEDAMMLRVWAAGAVSFGFADVARLWLASKLRHGTTRQ